MNKPIAPPAVDRLGAVGSRHPSAVWFFTAFLLLNTFSGYTENLGFPIGPDRLALATSALLITLDRRHPISLLRPRLIHMLMALLVCLTVLSAIAHDTLLERSGFFALLDRLVVPFAIFTIAPLLFRRATDRLLLLAALTALGAYLGLTSIAETFGPRALVFPRYILDPAVGIHFGRARGPFAESVANGLTMIACGYAAHAMTRLHPAHHWRLFSWLVVVLCSLGALLTLTRSVWLGLLLGMLILFARERRLRARIIAVFSVGILLVVFFLSQPSALSERVTERATSSRPVYDRRNTNAAAIRAIVEHPLTGVGWARFLHESDRYVRQHDEYPLTNTQIEVHNVVLARGAELGVLGGLLWVLTVLLGPVRACLIKPATAALRPWRDVLVGSFAAWFVAVLTSPVPYPLPNNLVWLFAGIVLGGHLLRAEVDERNTCTDVDPPSVARRFDRADENTRPTQQ